MLAGHHGRLPPVRITTKWDGAPAIFCGINPENGKFFVGTKSVFNKSNPKINYTPADIQRNHSGDLAKKLMIALRYLPQLGIRGVVQGDMMFTTGDLKNERIDGENYVTFRPNTITYALPANSNAAREVRQAKIGVVFHTSYSGKTMADMSASFNINVNAFNRTRDVWFRDANFEDASGAATFNIEETVRLTNYLSEAGKLFNQLNSRFLGTITVNSTYQVDIMAWNNLKVREGQEISNTADHVRGLIAYIDEKYRKRELEAKKHETKLNRARERNIIVGFYKKNVYQLKVMFDMMNMLTKAKNMIVYKLQQVRQIGTFIQTGDGYRVTHPEGFVCVDHIGNAVKLVDRLEFSHQNFTVAKNWAG